ncbi:PREDICTED: taste receptor type 2 member 7-like [Miniopterus natalensis]|uniref:taste receptor type 2 member 7-like n=1 Tax=Miniopterus natalensis TaxID=291302 RepID=UPI0007A6EAA7|nr:PREDICTED: taste receptor type 2 member 7-like [Miniopterus natalensis]
MASSLSAIPHAIIMAAEFITGITVNGFLIVIGCKELIKSRELAPMQLTLICIGMSRFGLLMVLMVQSFFSVFFPLLYEETIYGAEIMFLWMFFSSVSLWFATCLSVFYCFKLIGFTQPCFLWLKFRLAKLMPWLLLGSLLASLSMAALCIEVDYPKNLEVGVPGNATLRTSKVKIKQINDVLLVNLSLLFPLGVFVMCTFMLLVSLYKHTHRMQNGPHAARSASTEVHINALRTVLTFFLFFISYFAAFMANMTFVAPHGTQFYFVLKDIMAAYPSGHSVIIIFSNSKFQQPFRRLLCLKKNR